MRNGYLIVPKNRQGMIDQMMGSENEENLLFVELAPAEVAGLAPLLERFEGAFGFDSRGQTVEQLIDTRAGGLALDLAETQTRAGSTPEEREAARKMAEALRAALDFGSYVEFAL